MQKVITRYITKAAVTLVGILIISAGLQLMIRSWGVEPLVSMVGGHASEAYQGQNKEIRRQSTYYFREAMGLDRPFVPDLWPFDNKSLWNRPDQSLDEMGEVQPDKEEGKE